MNMSEDRKFQPQEAAHRWKLALIITSLSIAGIAIVAALVIVLAKDRSAASQTVLTAVLPLLAAWVSTVLAYYYSSESIEAATQSVKSLMSPEEKLKTILVVDEMIKLHEMVYFSYSDDLKVQDMLDRLEESGKGYRFPFLGDKNQPQYMLHKSAIDDALLKLSRAGDDITQITLKELYEKDAKLKALAEGSFGVVAEDASVADAKAEMQRIKDAQDVYVTDNGRKDGAVVGWLTNRDIEHLSKV
jgi:hypothetical protein